jgi:hypothetical protein
MGFLKVAVVVMGVMIVAGVTVLAYVIVTRANVTLAVTANVVLDEPGGTRIAGTALSGDRLAVLLQGGGPDRVVLVDPRSGKLSGRVSLGR